jgi:hypothetical protein
MGTYALCRGTGRTSRHRHFPSTALFRNGRVKANPGPRFRSFPLFYFLSLVNDADNHAPNLPQGPSPTIKCGEEKDVWLSDLVE